MKSVLSMVCVAIVVPLAGCMNIPAFGGPKEGLKCDAMSSVVRDADGKTKNIVTESCYGTYEKRGKGSYPTFPESRKDGDWTHRQSR